MAAQYDPTDHPLLSAEAAAAQGRGELDEQAELAMDLLGLRGTTYVGDAALTAVRAVVLQVNYQLEMGTEGYALKTDTQGDRTRIFTGELVNPVAQSLVTGLAQAAAAEGEVPSADAYATVRSGRFGYAT